MAYNIRITDSHLGDNPQYVFQRNVLDWVDAKEQALSSESHQEAWESLSYQSAVQIINGKD